MDGAGFRPLADYIHNLGLKFGIHIMRGIPRYAAHNNMKIKGTVRDLWNHMVLPSIDKIVQACVPAHSAVLYKLRKTI